MSISRGDTYQDLPLTQLAKPQILNIVAHSLRATRVVVIVKKDVTVVVGAPNLRDGSGNRWRNTGAATELPWNSCHGLRLRHS